MSESAATPDLATLAAGGKAILARTLALLESERGRRAATALLDRAWAAPKGHVIGITGPPGVGKSTLLSRLIRHDRAGSSSVAVLAVDPSSRRSRGALLGDRTRFDLPLDDSGCFVRSLAAGERLGGLADAAWPQMVLLRALFDRVIVETVGVGQSETEIADLADTVVLVIQPASGDSLQFIKSGIVEIPDFVVIGKADLGAPAVRARREVEAALAHRSGQDEGGPPRVSSVSAATGEGVDALMAALAEHAAGDREENRLAARRAAQSRRWLQGALKELYGRRGLARLGTALDDIARTPPAAPFALLEQLQQRLESPTPTPRQAGPG